MNAAPVKNTVASAPAKPRYWTRKRILRRLGLLLLLYIGFGAWFAWYTVRAKPHRMTTTPKAYGMAFETVRFASADGTPLAGWLCKATAAPTRGLLILCHGMDSTREIMLLKAQPLAGRGYATLLFDFRARGESGDARCTLGYRETEDLLAAIRYVKSRPDVRGLPLGVLGESMGGAVALMAAARSPEVQAVVAESPFTELTSAINNHFRRVFRVAGPVMAMPTRWCGERLIGQSCANIRPLDAVGKIAPRPLLLIQDEADAICPPSETAALLRAAGEPKTLWTVPRADHVGAFFTDPIGYTRRVASFFDSALD